MKPEDPCEDVEKLQKKLKLMTTLLELSKKFNSAMTFRSLFRLVVKEASSALDAERGSIFVVDSERDLLWTEIAQGTKRIEISKDDGIAGWVARNGKAYISNEPYNDKVFNKNIDLERNFKTRNIAALPLLNRTGRVIGVFEIINKKDGGFSKLDMELLEGLAGQVSISLETVLANEEIRRSFESFIEVMAATIDAKRPIMAGHSERVSMYAVIIARRMQLSKSQVEAVRLAGLLHDYGKIGIPDSILQKSSKLTDEEYTLVKEHVVITKKILRKIRFSDDLKMVYEIAGYHHERVDGNGYPQGLKGCQIPLEAKILAVVDAFDAAVSEREYKKSKACDVVLSEIIEDSGKAYDPDVVNAFCESYEEIIKVKKRYDRKYK
ncbi:HD-GYP domain-containing protein [bacterium]|nr:HD-GYP domain-containing protein [bacterium]